MDNNDETAQTDKELLESETWIFKTSNMSQIIG
jgi:hypothetical protein